MSETKLEIILKGIKTEIGAGRVIFPKTSEDRVWNQASQRAMTIVENYENGVGIFQFGEEYKKAVRTEEAL